MVRMRLEKKWDSRWGGFWRLVTGVDPSKKDGWAFSGPFLREGKLYDFAEGDVLICKYGVGSWRHRKYYAAVYRIEGGKMISKMENADWFNDFLDVRDTVAGLLKKEKGRRE